MNVSYHLKEGHYRPILPRPYCGLQEPKLPEGLHKLPASQQIPLMAAYNAAMSEYEAGWAQHREDLLAYRTAEAEAEALFKHDLFEELNISNNPKRELFFEKVWELGSGEGLSRVLEIAENLVALIET